MRMRRLLNSLLRQSLVVTLPPEPVVEKGAAKRRITYAKVSHVSLVSRGANKMPVLLKSGNRVQFNMLFKQSAEEAGLLHAIVYVPEENGAIDTQGDVAPRTVVKQMAHDFIANGAHLDVEHDLQVLTPQQASVAETFLVQKTDTRFHGWVDNYGAAVDATDSWGMIIKLSDPELQKAVKDGRISGVSLFGLAEVEPIAKTNLEQDTDMTPAELAKALEESNAKLIEALAKALKPAEPTPTPKVEPAPAPVVKAEVKFEGDPLKLEDVQKHQEKVFVASLDLGKPEDLAKLAKHLEAKSTAPVKGVSNQPAADDQPLVDTSVVKSEQDQMKAGTVRGASINKLLGRV